MGDLRIPNMLLFFTSAICCSEDHWLYVRYTKSQCDRNQDDPPSLFRSTDCGGVSAPLSKDRLSIKH